MSARRPAGKAGADARSLGGSPPDAISLLEYLNSTSGDLDEKDAIYAALIELVQARGEHAELAMALAWLGLWPALDAIFRQRLRHFRNVPGAR